MQTYIKAAVQAASMAGREIFQSKLKLNEVEKEMDAGREVKLMADRVLDDMILKELKKTNLPILSEETGYLPGKSDSDLVWIVDPLDGSANFSRGIKLCAVSIALFRGKDEPLAGIIYDINTDLLIIADCANNAKADNITLAVAETSSTAECLSEGSLELPSYQTQCFSAVLLSQ